MVQIALFGIASEEKPLEIWKHPDREEKVRGLFEKITQRVAGESSKLTRGLQVGGFSVWYFRQEGFLFVLAAEGSERSSHMQNYLRVVADIFYESYDERRFPTVLDRLMTEINRIENAHGGEEEHDGLIASNFQRQKQKLSEVLRRKDQESRLAFAVSAALFLAILLLAAYYFWRRKQ